MLLSSPLKSSPGLAPGGVGLPTSALSDARYKSRRLTSIEQPPPRFETSSTPRRGARRGYSRELAISPQFSPRTHYGPRHRFPQGGEVIFESPAVAENRPVGPGTHFTLASCPAESRSSQRRESPSSGGCSHLHGLPGALPGADRAACGPRSQTQTFCRLRVWVIGAAGRIRTCGCMRI